MSRLQWGQVGQKFFENGVDRGVLYVRDDRGEYPQGVAWNGLTSVSEAPSGAESNKQYADNQVYVNLKSAEEYSATIEAFMYPDEFAACNGEAEVVPGVTLGQQNRKSFGFSYRTIVGNDVNPNLGHKIHVVYGADAAPSDKAYNTVNADPELASFSWEISTTPVEVGTIGGVEYKPSATLTFKSTNFDPSKWAELEAVLWGSEGQDARLPLPRDLIALMTGTTTMATPVQPTYDEATNTVTIPTVTGVEYLIDGEVVTGNVVLTETSLVVARPLSGYTFPEPTDVDWLYEV